MTAVVLTKHFMEQMRVRASGTLVDAPPAEVAEMLTASLANAKRYADTTNGRMFWAVGFSKGRLVALISDDGLNAALTVLTRGMFDQSIARRKFILEPDAS
jgi:hypothetical protein